MIWGKVMMKIDDDDAGDDTAAADDDDARGGGEGGSGHTGWLKVSRRSLYSVLFTITIIINNIIIFIPINYGIIAIIIHYMFDSITNITILIFTI